MIDKDNKMYVAHAAAPLYINPKMINRHGLIAGATGTGKTVSLQVLAETFSIAGVPCFLADMKGDLSGVSQPGAVNKFIDARNKLYYIVPLTAYNTGRNKGLQELYNFVYQHINEKAIQSPKDIEILDQIFTSIIAYHKVLNQNKKEK